MSTELSAHTITEFDEKGVVIIPGVFSGKEANRIRSAAYMALTHIKGGKNRLQKGKHAGYESPALLFWPALSSEYLNAIRCDRRLVQIVQSILGPNVKQINNQVYYRLPGDGDSFAWHQDSIFRRPVQDFPGIESGYLQTIVVVDEIRDDNGPVEYILGSHKEKFEDNPDERAPALRKFKRRGHKGEKLLAKPGDVMIWSVNVVHGSEPNNSQFPRMTYMNGFARADCSRYNPDYLINGDVQKSINVSAFK